MRPTPLIFLFLNLTTVIQRLNNSNRQKYRAYPATKKGLVVTTPQPPGNRTLSCRAYLRAQDTDRWSCRLQHGGGPSVCHDSNGNCYAWTVSPNSCEEDNGPLCKRPQIFCW
ncbi:hypothetical protein TNIN_94141 [Trichonephila inaurata madagascariensis]|uniref:Secreted protein n=1 Tax=Trichonephila inaurata madagascariensis TaxID=2747483 RepID=A0A8X6MB82_9ARAC|nr:hypothetical protein TNIN_94141 [Trichonephila inaurata madagascariensis]